MSNDQRMVDIGLLEELEWHSVIYVASEEQNLHACPSCGELERDGHAADCKLRAIIDGPGVEPFDKSRLKRLVTQVFGEGYQIVPPAIVPYPVKIISAGSAICNGPDGQICDWEMSDGTINTLSMRDAIAARVQERPRPTKDCGWLEAAVAWEVCASIHEKWAKKKDALYSTRHADFVKHAADARKKAQ